MTLTTEDSAEMLNVMYDARATHFLMVASLAVLAYDHLISIQEEVRLMWTGPRGLFNYLYVWNRYFGLAVTCFNATRGLREIESDNVCQVYLQLDSAMTSVIMTTVDLILVLRVWILYGRKKGFLWLSLAFILAELISLIVMGFFSFKPLTKFPHFGPSLAGCLYPTALPRIFTYHTTPALIVTLSGFVLTVYKCVSAIDWSRRTRMPVVDLFLRDGAIWFLAVFSLMFACMSLWAFARPSLAGLIVVSVIPVYSIIGSRVLLNIKDLLAGEEPADGTSRIETIEFFRCSDDTIASSTTLVANEP